MATGDDGEHQDPVLGGILSSLVSEITAAFQGHRRTFYDREVAFFNQVTAISGTIRSKPLGPERKVRREGWLGVFYLQSITYLGFP